ncbi:MAG: hypothetical protein HYX86_01775 [Chloroflexi bacterium]|nr:hypothetical protein [Chloroflexota bacterium]
MELGDYFQVLRKHIRIILATFLLTTALAVLFSETQTPIYRAEASLQVKPAVFNYNVILTANQLLNQFALQVKTTGIAQQVLEQVPLEMTPRQLLKQVTVDPVPEDFLIIIDADFPNDGEIAKQVANSFANIFVDYHAQRSLSIDPLERIEISVLVPADRYWLHWPSTRTLALAGGLTGLFLGILLAFIREYLEADLLRSVPDVERQLEVPALGAIPTGSSRR